MLYPHAHLFPNIYPTVRMAENTSIVGDVTLEEDCNVWYGAVLRGDVHYIRVGARTNIQDNAVIHVGDSHPTVIGQDVTIGHGAIVHGCTVGDNCLIGMGAILLNGCTIGDCSIIAAGALVTEGTVIPPGSVVMGVPGRVQEEVLEADYAKFSASVLHYLRLAEQQLPLYGGRD